MNTFWAFCWYALRNRQHPAQISTSFLSSLIWRKSTTIWDFFSLPFLTWKDFSSCVCKCQIFPLCTKKTQESSAKNLPLFTVGTRWGENSASCSSRLSCRAIAPVPINGKLDGLQPVSMFWRRKKILSPYGESKNEFSLSST